MNNVIVSKAVERLMAHPIWAGRETGQGAGIIFYCTGTNRLLLVKRSTYGDYPGTWCCLGGGVEEGETLQEAAFREAYEEGGYNPEVKPELQLIHTDRQDGFTYTNFAAYIDEEFEPKLNEEHTEFKWVGEAEFDSMMNEIHPGLIRAIG